MSSPSSSWKNFHSHNFDSDEKWKSYLDNLTFPENLNDHKKNELVFKYKKKYYSQHVEKLVEFQLPYTQVEVSPHAKHDSTIIFLHGLGDQGSGWLDVFQKIKKTYPELASCKFILPNASAMSVSLNMGYVMPAWYDLMSLSMDGPEDIAGMEKCFANVDILIEREVQEFGLDPSRIIIGGFSQGGSVALYHGLTNKYKLGGVIALSTWMPNRKKILTFVGKDLPNKTTPIFQAHGTSDNVVKYEWGASSKKFVVESLLEGNESHYTFKTYTGMGHSSSLQEIKDLAEWLISVFGSK
ncbi:hypothetical protein C9374_006272 [Naegleria lovaniensis]|uniref:Phospholipase/carboxylesterase/thioesterase domain-containing protein n=1 Tax=Naegleria lovaniensis TaxID=51637 RepID=A0AA88GNI3_NAELO|nr:uncharacterized protein C9374_006272 [Naegleria lovaniensis]KAG2381283.1 hypothetical protein C9374_006272 [Naegleria lovaniensis]